MGCARRRPPRRRIGWPASTLPGPSRPASRPAAGRPPAGVHDLVHLPQSIHAADPLARRAGEEGGPGDRGWSGGGHRCPGACRAARGGRPPRRVAGEAGARGKPEGFRGRDFAAGAAQGDGRPDPGRRAAGLRPVAQGGRSAAVRSGRARWKGAPDDAGADPSRLRDGRPIIDSGDRPHRSRPSGGASAGRAPRSGAPGTGRPRPSPPGHGGGFRASGRRQRRDAGGPDPDRDRLRRRSRGVPRATCAATSPTWDCSTMEADRGIGAKD